MRPPSLSCRACRASWGLRRLVGALDDAEARVREAAAHALRASAGTQPYRWAHVVFHPRPDVRTVALQLGGPHGAEPLGAYLRTDSANADLARQCAWPNRRSRSCSICS